MAIELTEQDALFLHIPKTGGTWVERVLLEHVPGARHARRRSDTSRRHGLPQHLYGRHRFVFTFVRHPVTWYESWWRFVMAGKFHDREVDAWHPQRIIRPLLNHRKSFGDFVDAVLANQPGYVTRLYEWYIGPPGSDLIDFVGRQEWLTEDLDAALLKIGVDLEYSTLRSVPPANAPPPQGVEWTDELLRRVVESERPAIDRWYNGHERPE